MRISDWSSDVCSSDLAVARHHLCEAGLSHDGGGLLGRGHGELQVPQVDVAPEGGIVQRPLARQPVARGKRATGPQHTQHFGVETWLVRDVDERVLAEHRVETRSEERRVGKEWLSKCRYRRLADHKKKKKTTKK